MSMLTKRFWIANTMILVWTCFAPSHRWASVRVAAAQEVRLTPVWVRVGDSFGAVDQDNGTASVESAEFSPDGSLIASGAKRGWEVRLWDVETGDMRWERKHQEEVEVVAFSRDGQFVASGGEDNTLRIWETSTGDSVAALPHIASIDGMRFSHDGSILAAGDEAGLVTLWSVPDWTKLHEVPQGPDELQGDDPGVHSDVNSIDFTLDDRFMAVASRNLKVRIWRIESDNRLTLVRELDGHTGSIKSTRISPDRRFVAAGANDSGVKVWDFESGELIASLPAFARIMEAVEFTPDGKYLVVGGNENENTDDIGAIRFYRVPEEGSETFELVTEEPVFRQEYFHFNADGSRLVSSHEDGTLRLWDVREIEVPAPLFSDIQAESGRLYAPWVLQTNRPVYSDRSTRITALPSFLDPARAIRTANNDTAARDSSFLRFDLLEAADVYVAFDPRATILPAWLQDWERTGEVIGLDDPSVNHLDLYTKPFPAGPVSLGGNRAQPAEGALTNYIVAAVANGNTGTSIALEGRDVAGDLLVRGNYPNPFRSSTTIAFDVKRPGRVVFEVFDALGRRRSDVLRAPVYEGKNEILLDTAHWPSGTYLYRLRLMTGHATISRQGKLVRKD